MSASVDHFLLKSVVVVVYPFNRCCLSGVCGLNLVVCMQLPRNPILHHRHVVCVECSLVRHYTVVNTCWFGHTTAYVCDN